MIGAPSHPIFAPAHAAAATSGPDAAANAAAAAAAAASALAPFLACHGHYWVQTTEWMDLRTGLMRTSGGPGTAGPYRTSNRFACGRRGYGLDSVEAARQAGWFFHNHVLSCPVLCKSLQVLRCGAAAGVLLGAAGGLFGGYRVGQKGSHRGTHACGVHAAFPQRGSSREVDELRSLHREE